MYFLMFWIMSAGGFSKYARYQILLRKTYFINVFFPILKVVNVPTSIYHLRVFFLTFSQFCSVLWFSFAWYCVRRYNLSFYCIRVLFKS